MFSGKYIFSGNANFWKRKMFSWYLVALQKIFRKIFSGVWKRRRKTQIRKCRITQIRKTQATNPGKHKYFYRKCIKSGKRNQNPAKEMQPVLRSHRRAVRDRRARSSALVGRARSSDAHRSSARLKNWLHFFCWVLVSFA